MIVKEIEKKYEDLIKAFKTTWAVSYTHLDVYKRQPFMSGGILLR